MSPRFVLAGNLQGGSVESSNHFDYSSSHVTPGAYRHTDDDDDALFHYLVQTFTENHSNTREGESQCPDEMNEELGNGPTAAWSGVQGENVCMVLLYS